MKYALVYRGSAPPGPGPDPGLDPGGKATVTIYSLIHSDITCTSQSGEITKISDSTSVDKLSLETGTYTFTGTHNGTELLSYTLTVSSAAKYEVVLPKIVTWAGGADDEVSLMCLAHRKKVISLTNYWNVGDARIIHVNEMEAYNNTQSTYTARDLSMVLLHPGGLKYEGNITECAFVVGITKSFGDTVLLDKDASTMPGGWPQCGAKQWFDTTFYNALPESIRPIFQKWTNSYMTVSGAVSTSGYFAPPMECNFTGNNNNSLDKNGHGNYFQFKYYETIANTPTMSWMSTLYATQNGDAFSILYKRGSAVRVVYAAPNERGWDMTFHGVI